METCVSATLGKDSVAMALLNHSNEKGIFLLWKPGRGTRLMPLIKSVS